MDGIAPKSAREDPVVGESHKAANPEVPPDEIDASDPPLERTKEPLKRQPVRMVAAAAEDAAEDLPGDVDDEEDCEDGTPLLTLQGAANGSIPTALSVSLLRNIPGGPGASPGVDPHAPTEQNIDRNKAGRLRRADSARPPGAAVASRTLTRGPLNDVDVSSGPQGAAAIGASRRNTEPLERADSIRPPGAARGSEAPPGSLPRTNLFRHPLMVAQDSISTVSDMSFRGLGMISEYSVGTNREKACVLREGVGLITSRVVCDVSLGMVRTILGVALVFGCIFFPSDGARKHF